MFLVVSALMLGAMSVALAGSKSEQAQIKRGQRVFQQCKLCHTLDPSGEAGPGPDLYRIVGKKVGQAGKKAGFAYSQALLDTKVSWTEQELDKFIEAPAKFAPGTSMAFSGVKDREDRKAVIEYLKAAPALQSIKKTSR